MQIFAYTENLNMKTLLEMECKELLGIKPVLHDSCEDLKYVLSIFQSIDLLVIDVPLDERRNKQLYDILQYSRNKIKKILIYGDNEWPDYQFFSRSEITELFEEIKKCSGVDKRAAEEWTAIPISTLIHFQSLPFDLYIKLSDQRFVKRIPAYEVVSFEVTEALFQKGVTDLYCDRKYKREFSMMLINNMINKVERTYSSYSLDLLAQQEVFKTTREIVQSLGISGRVIEVCEASVARMMKSVMSKDDELRSFIQCLSKDRKLNFHFKLINLTNYIGGQLILEMAMPQHEEQVRKLICASYFCDMTLTNPGHLYHRKADDAGALTLHEQNEVNFHALKASEIVSKNKDIETEVAVVIRQHHGSFSGIGFPVEKSSQLLPLSKILIVSQELAFAILTQTEVPAMDVLKEQLRKIQSESLRELVNVLENTFRENSKAIA